MEYKYEVTSMTGFLERVATHLLTHGYYFFVPGTVPDGKNPAALHKKLLAKYDVNKSEVARRWRKQQGLGNVQYVRFECSWILMATHGDHPIGENEADNLTDVRRSPLRIRDYSVCVKRGEHLVRMRVDRNDMGGTDQTLRRPGRAFECHRAQTKSSQLTLTPPVKRPARLAPGTRRLLFSGGRWPVINRSTMRKSKVLEKLRSGQVARICSLGAMIPYFPKMAAHFRFEGIFLDGEHRRWDSRVIESMLLQHHEADIDCIFRAPTLEKTGLCRLLEDGATGLMIPHVSTPELAEQLVQAVKFPPVGDRGLDGAGFDADFLVDCPADYVEQANRETCLVVQIETPLAIKNVDAIAAVEGVDVLFLGPGDLALRLGCTPAVDDPVLMEAQQNLAAAARKHGKAWGRPVGDTGGLRTLMNLGAQFITFGSDFSGIHSHLAATSSALDGIFSEA